MMEAKHENKEMKENRVADPALPSMMFECGGCVSFYLCVIAFLFADTLYVVYKINILMFS